MAEVYKYEESRTIGINSVKATIHGPDNVSLQIKHCDPYVGVDTLEFEGIEEIVELRQMLQRIEHIYSIMSSEVGT
jgi:hypothetical protein